MKILILKPSSLGDVIHALPVLRLLKLRHPSAEIFWWIDSALAPLIEGDRDLAGIVRFERRRWSKPPHWPEMFRSIRWLRAQKFDLVIDLQGLLRSGAFAWLSAGKQLIGLEETREGAHALYDLAVPRPSYFTHAVDWYRAVLPPLGVPVHDNFDWLPERSDVAERVKEKLLNSAPTAEARNQQWVLLQPGARWDNKRWPAEHFATAVAKLAHLYPGIKFAVIGGQDEIALGETIRRVAPEKIFNLCGQTTLAEMIELVRQSALLITNDTGPMHVAAAIGRPLIALFGPTEARRTGPYRQLHNVLRVPALPCAPCMKASCRFERPLECLRALDPAEVVAKAQTILS